MKARYLHIILLSCIAILLVACVYDELNDNQLPNNVKAIEVIVQSAPPPSSTRAPKKEVGEDPLNENKVENLEVYFFDTDGAFHSKIAAENLKRLNEADNAFNLRILVPLDQVASYEGKTLQLCVVANHTSTIPATPTLEELQQIVEERDLNPSPAKAQDKFLMDGKVSTTISWGATKLFTVSESLSLQRAAAKIRLRIVNALIEVDGNQYTPDGQPEVKLVHYTNKTTLLQGGEPYTVQANEWKTEEYQEMSEVVFPDGNTYTSTKVPYYAYENNWANDGKKETYLLIRLNLLDEESNKLPPYYYRIPVNYRLPVEGVEDTELHQLKRNHLYDITTNIEELGSEDESEPFEIESSIAIQPWVESDIIDGNIQNIHYLMVKEKTPEMNNITTREVEYVSDLPIEIKINQVGYEWYDQVADSIKVVWNGGDGKTKITYTNGLETGRDIVDTPYDGVTIIDPPAVPPHTKNSLTINHKIPNNYVPFEISFTVTQKGTESGKTPLSETVIVTQYPGKYVTGKKSNGPGGGINEAEDGGYADFRYHSPLGVFYNPLTPKKNTNTVLYQINTFANSDKDFIGDPTDSEGKTKRDEVFNRLISPQFIIASQYGLTLTTPQYTRKEIKTPWVETLTTPKYGPFEKQPDVVPYYHKTSIEPMKQAFVVNYESAEEKCFNYFEDEYGMDGEYKEQYISGIKVEGGKEVYIYGSRMVKKTFKNKGRWRMPTKAEVELIDRVQDDSLSAVKYLLQGSEYLSAQTGIVYNFADNVWVNRGMGEGQEGSVRCVFDTYKLKNHP